MKIALVTGGGTGIGRAAAIELNKIDFEVYVIGRREKELKETSSLRTNKNFDIVPVTVDITKSEKLNRFLKKLKKETVELICYSTMRAWAHLGYP
tara:strand:+ start:1408 stop:1692 length:285 start_codon:yes stop_codon:yes gene_type:complete